MHANDEPINVKNNSDKIPLYLDVKNEKANIVKMILEAICANKEKIIKLEDNYDYTPLHEIVDNGKTDIVHMLL
jgi:ankyrin repeat protein